MPSLYVSSLLVCPFVASFFCSLCVLPSLILSFLYRTLTPLCISFVPSLHVPFRVKLSRNFYLIYILRTLFSRVFYRAIIFCFFSSLALACRVVPLFVLFIYV